ncbi:uncharacterized protein FOBCDRAFT_313291 [Fusarium oxysporum Fo47]|uniref:Uncharacterized protein n=1 Tax=Fusarium oxysporum Fo47 TaxID=660027 RepID=W9LBX4_FUSOX|nr:uncharacterized protein FOBCDRAFT_313291 [Fusarium oxysporum Fo47]EWZ52529.1 hypothetical protein FOZG_02294 [Fusarium oxysporum Fo47]WJG34360.1 hypothetical protein FOBCDRAFT_313291 [Fusarium oxysporum Fo47]
MAPSFPSSWIVNKSNPPQAIPSPTTTPKRRKSPSPSQAPPAKPKPRATLFTRPPPPPSLSTTPTRRLSPAATLLSRVDGSLPFARRYDSPPSTPRSLCDSFVFSCRDSSHFHDMDDAVLPNGPCGRPGCCGDEMHPSSFLDMDCLIHNDEHNAMETGEGVALLWQAPKALPKQSPFTGLGHEQDAPVVFPSSWIVRSTGTSTNTPVLKRDQVLPHAMDKGRSRMSTPMNPAMAPSNPSPLRSAESINRIMVPPSPGIINDGHQNAHVKTTTRKHTLPESGSESVSWTTEPSDDSCINDKYLWELKERPTQRELIDCWLQSTSDREPFKRVKRSHWLNNGSDASGDADEPHSRLPVSDAYSVYSSSTQNTRATRLA